MNNKCFVLTLTCNPLDLEEAFGSPRGLFKVLSNSKKKVGYVSQRAFWKRYVAGGFYTAFPTPEGNLQFILMASLKQNLSAEHLKTRFFYLLPPSLWEGISLVVDNEPRVEHCHNLWSFYFLFKKFGNFRKKPDILPQYSISSPLVAISSEA